MSVKTRLTTFAAIVIFLTSLSALGDEVEQQESPVQVACVGDSITYGARLNDPANDSYPAILQKLLGQGHKVANLGVGGCTLIRKGKPTVWNQLRRMRRGKPSIIVISLGTNDTCGGDRKCWEHKDDFPNDCRDLLDALLALPSKPRIWICAPSPMVVETAGLSSSRKKNLEQRNPRLQELIVIIRTVAEEKNVGFIDLNTPLSKKPELFTAKDGVHPNKAGYLAIAELVYAALRESAASDGKIANRPNARAVK